MTPPPALVACPSCADLVLRGASTCPHCDARMPREGALAAATAAVLIGLSLAACPVAEPDYGVPATESGGSSGSSSSTAAESASSTSSDSTSSDSASSGSATDSGTDSGTSSTTAEPAYGVPDTTTTTTGTSGEPAYGVPATTTGPALPEPQG